MTTAFPSFLTAAQSHRGPRETNQDTVLSIDLPENRWLLAVADGMGGLEEGELASKTALGAFYRSLSGGGGLVEAVSKANAAVVREAKGRTMGTTLVAAILSDRRVEIVNVGDSRAYVSDPLGLIQITRDHTLAEEATRQGAVPFGNLDEDTNRWSTALARYLGGSDEVEPDRFGPMDIAEGGWLLLSSDGLHGVIPPDEIQRFLEEARDPEAAATRLVEEALQRDTQDNVSVALAYCPGGEIEETSGPLMGRVEAPSRRQTPEEPRKGEPTSSLTDPGTSARSGEKGRPEPGGRTPPPAAAGPPRGRGSRGSKVLIGRQRQGRTRKGLARLVKILLIVVPLVVAVAFLMNWILSSTP